MLTLSRGKQESIIIQAPQGTIVVTVLEITPGRCRLAIEAPRHIPIHRAETVEQQQIVEQ